jgi:hypothetical protein
MKWELWKNAFGYDFFVESNQRARELLEPDSKLIWTVEAESFDEAQQAKYDFLGWGKYNPES